MTEKTKKINSSSKNIILSNKIGTRGESSDSQDLSDEILRYNSILNQINSLFDINYQKSCVNNVLHILDKYYFRSRIIGADNGLPQRNDPMHPLIFCSNHSGMGFPWDGMIMTGKFLEMGNFRQDKYCRALVAPTLCENKHMNPYMIDNFWKRIGGVPATLENFEAMMHTPDTDVMIYPEGVPGIGKGFDKKYQYQKISSSFIRMALKFKTDIIPISTVNAEYCNPYSYNNDELNKLVSKLDIPFLPLGPITAMVPFAPWVFYFALPAKITYVIGKPIKVYEMIDKPLHMIKKSEINHIKDVVQQHLQLHLTASVEQYGQDPYQWEELGDLWRDNLDKIMYILPSGWPLLFHENDRMYLANPTGENRMEYDKTSYFAALAKNLSILSYNIPVAGWGMILKNAGIV